MVGKNRFVVWGFGEWRSSRKLSEKMGFGDWRGGVEREEKFSFWDSFLVPTRFHSERRTQIL
jgi:hypothetical protein